MTQLVYDSGFEGFLTAVFEVYERKLDDVRIIRESHYQPQLNEVRLDIISDSEKAERVWKGLKIKLSVAKRDEVYKTFLSERADVESILLRFIRLAFQSAESSEKNYSDSAVLQISQIARQVHREKHRMEAFVRFQRTQDDLYYAVVEPDFNVLPLIIKHFKDRYADQHWMIYDRKRGYGVQYNKKSGMVHEVELVTEDSMLKPFLPTSVVHEEEGHYQQLWRQYFASVNIGARKNTTLHVRHVPLRYWKYLTEKRS